MALIIRMSLLIGGTGDIGDAGSSVSVFYVLTVGVQVRILTYTTSYIHLNTTPSPLYFALVSPSTA